MPLIVSLSSFLLLLFVTLAIPFLPVPGVGTVLPSPGRGRAGVRGGGGMVGWLDALVGRSVVGCKLGGDGVYYLNLSAPWNVS